MTHSKQIESRRCATACKGKRQCLFVQSRKTMFCERTRGMLELLSFVFLPHGNQHFSLGNLFVKIDSDCVLFLNHQCSVSNCHLHWKYHDFLFWSQKEHTCVFCAQRTMAGRQSDSRLIRLATLTLVVEERSACNYFPPPRAGSGGHTHNAIRRSRMVGPDETNLRPLSFRLCLGGSRPLVKM